MARFSMLVLLLLASPAAGWTSPAGAPVPPGPLSRALSLAEADKAPEAKKILASLDPDLTALGPYHYIYGRAFAASGAPFEAFSHYRRAYIYATGPSLKETAFFLAIETEVGMGYYFEAKTDCEIFLKLFPDSGRTPAVRILLARSLAGTGRLREAARQFDLAGKTAEGLYGKANVLQRMGMTGEASKAYAGAASVDGRYPGTSEETRCWMGENLRLSGDPARAKALLLSVSGEGHRDRANIGLGEIALAEGRTDEAIRRFGSVASSKDKALGTIAQLRLADIETAAGKSREASLRLEGILAEYPFSREHDEAVLRLARLKGKAGDDAAALSLLSKLVPRASPVRLQALDEIERILLAARGKGADRLVSLWNAGGRWLMDASREKTLVAVAEQTAGTGAPYLELVRWLSRYGSAAVRPKYLVLLARHYADAFDAAGLRECLAALKKMGASDDDVLRVEADLKLREEDYRGAADALLSLRRFEESDIGRLSETLPHVERPGKAVAVLEDAVARYGAGPRALRRLADALFDAGRKVDAVRYYRMTAEKDPSDEWACYRLAILLGKDGGAEYLARVRKDPTLARMANAARKEMSLNAR